MLHLHKDIKRRRADQRVERAVRQGLSGRNV
jgi:hypothetical protein